MSPDYARRGHLLYAILLGVTALLFSPGSRQAIAGTPDKTGANADLYSITIAPESVPTGSHPQVVGFVSNTSSRTGKTGGKAVFDVTAVIAYPNGKQKSLLWRDVRFTAQQRKAYSCGTGYDTMQPGTYKVTFSVYDSGKKHLYSSLSKTFTVFAPQAVSKPTLTPKPSYPPAAQRQDYPPAVIDRPDSTVQQPLQAEKQAAPPRRETMPERRIIGIGGHVNTLNYSAGGALTLWPLKNLALQGTYGTGTFTSYEARLFYRIPLSRRLNPYLGAGYLHTERKGNVLGADVTIEGDSFTVFAGLEMQIYKALYLYVDASGTPLKLEKEFTSGTTQATATVKYAPVTVCTGITIYLF